MVLTGSFLSNNTEPNQAALSDFLRKAEMLVTLVESIGLRKRAKSSTNFIFQFTRLAVIEWMRKDNCLTKGHRHFQHFTDERFK